MKGSPADHGAISSAGHRSSRASAAGSRQSLPERPQRGAKLPLFETAADGRFEGQAKIASTSAMGRGAAFRVRLGKSFLGKTQLGGIGRPTSVSAGVGNETSFVGHRRPSLALSSSGYAFFFGRRPRLSPKRSPLFFPAQGGGSCRSTHGSSLIACGSRLPGTTG
jgi:hypothetical protein